MVKAEVKKKENDLTTGNLFWKIIKVSLPLMLSGILQLFYNAADLIVCGQFGSDKSVAAISSTNSLINLIIMFISIFNRDSLYYKKNNILTFIMFILPIITEIILVLIGMIYF